MSLFAFAEYKKPLFVRYYHAQPGYYSDYAQAKL